MILLLFTTAIRIIRNKRNRSKIVGAFRIIEIIGRALEASCVLLGDTRIRFGGGVDSFRRRQFREQSPF